MPLSVTAKSRSKRKGIHTDEVKPLTRRVAKVSHNEVDAIFITADLCVQPARPDLSVGGELIRVTTDVEVQRL
jgi:phage gpG-like protein